MKTILTRFTLIILGLSFIGLIFYSPTLAKIDPETIVGAWLLDGDAKDASQAKNHGKINGSPGWEQGKFGKAIVEIEKAASELTAETKERTNIEVISLI